MGAVRHDVEGDESRNGTDSTRQARQQVQQQRTSARIVGVQEDGEVADLLRIRAQPRPRIDAERHRGHDRRSDNGAIDEVAEGVADEDWKDAPVVDLAVMRDSAATRASPKKA
jgi:hypothetical protein